MVTPIIPIKLQLGTSHTSVAKCVTYRDISQNIARIRPPSTSLHATPPLASCAANVSWLWFPPGTVTCLESPRVQMADVMISYDIWTVLLHDFFSFSVGGPLLLWLRFTEAHQTHVRRPTATCTLVFAERTPKSWRYTMIKKTISKWYQLWFQLWFEGYDKLLCRYTWTFALQKSALTSQLFPTLWAHDELRCLRGAEVVTGVGNSIKGSWSTGLHMSWVCWDIRFMFFENDVRDRTLLHFFFFFQKNIYINKK